MTIATPVHIVSGLIQAIDSVADEVGLDRKERGYLLGSLEHALAGTTSADAVTGVLDMEDPLVTPELMGRLAYAVAVYVEAAEHEHATLEKLPTLTSVERAECLLARTAQELPIDEYDEALAEEAYARLRELQVEMDAQRATADAARRRLSARRQWRRAERHRIDALAAREQRAAEAVAA